MRHVKALDHWRHVYNNAYRRYIQSFNYSNIAGVGSGEIVFRGGINAICGGNGVGKSTLLDAIACATISPEYAINHINHLRFIDAVFTVNMIVDGVNITRSMIFSGGIMKLEENITARLRT